LEPACITVSHSIGCPVPPFDHSTEWLRNAFA
jgi:hypothetical protein